MRSSSRNAFNRQVALLRASLKTIFQGGLESRSAAEIRAVAGRAFNSSGKSYEEFLQSSI
jgi:hypothetical protein